MSYSIAVVKGDGIGPEIISSALIVLNKIGEKYKHTFEFKEIVAGGVAIDTFGVPLPDESLKACLESDSVLLGAVGGPKWDGLASELRPEKALLGIRKSLELFANIRPVKLFNALESACPLKPEIAKLGIDLVVVRELTGGIYFGKSFIEGDTAFDTELYSRPEIERIGKAAFSLALTRNKRVCSIDKANILKSSQLWRKVMHEISASYPEVEYSDMLVDNAAMQLIRNPSQFDVIVTSNMFGDILSDEASMLTGSIGMLPSASLGDGTRGMYEPIHGSAPDIAGQNKANPIATILSAAMMLRLSFGLAAEAEAIEKAVMNVLNAGHRTADIAAQGPVVSCDEMTRLIVDAIS